MTDANIAITKNQEYVVNIEGYTSSGDGVARVNGYAVFIPYVLKGEVWKIKILKVTNTAIYAKGLEAYKTSESRVQPSCPYFKACGGCNCWHMDYEEELRFKLDKVNDALQRIGHQSVTADDIIPADNSCRYRNKGIFNVGMIDDRISYGFFHERSHDLIPIDQCLIQNETGERVSAVVTAFMAKHHFLPFDEETGRGTVRHVFCRSAHYTPDRVACLISARGFGSFTDELVDALLLACPELTGIVLCINKGRYNSVLDGDFYTLYGNPDITDYLGRYEFVISPQAFYQVNPAQAEKLYAKAVEYATSGSADSCLELYCGSGTISMFLSAHFKNVFSTEIVPESIDNAKENAVRNHIENIDFMCGDAAETAQFILKSGRHFDCVVVDPPRKGMDEAAIDAVTSIAPERIVYVSCNPSTLSRDILRFNSSGYHLDQATAVDMFPRTCHVETVSLLSRTEGTTREA